MNHIIDSLAKVALWEFITSNAASSPIIALDQSIPGLAIKGGMVIRSKLRKQLYYYLLKVEIM